MPAGFLIKRGFQPFGIKHFSGEDLFSPVPPDGIGIVKNILSAGFGVGFGCFCANINGS
jgi:hypothetical protein